NTALELTWASMVTKARKGARGFEDRPWNSSNSAAQVHYMSQTTMKYTAPPYMHDVLPFEPSKDGWLHAARWRAVESTFRETCRQFGYREIRTPVMEATELFTRTIGEGTDIVSKEMFTFADRGGRSMTLRPEGTAPVIRSYIENKLHGEHPV